MKSWDDSENRGYSWKHTPESVATYAAVFLLLFVFAASIKVVSCFIKKLRDQPSFSMIPAFYWALATVSTLWNLVDTFFNLLFLYVLFDKATNDESRYYGYSKLAVLGTILLFGLTWMSCGCFMAPSLLPPLKCICPFCCTCCCTRRGTARYLHGCAFFQIAFFVFLAVANVIPAVILMFARPVVVLSDIALLSTIVFSLVIWITVLYTAQRIKTGTSTVDTSRHLKYANGICCLVLLGLFIIVIFFVVVLYLKILIRGAESSDHIKLLFSFIPSAVIGGTGFLIKRKFLDKRKKQFDLSSEEQHTEQTVISLADIEEGQGNHGNHEVPEVYVLTDTGTTEGQGVCGGGDEDGHLVNETEAGEDSQGLSTEETEL